MSHHHRLEVSPSGDAVNRLPLGVQKLPLSELRPSESSKDEDSPAGSAEGSVDSQQEVRFTLHHGLHDAVAVFPTDRRCSATTSS